MAGEEHAQSGAAAVDLLTSRGTLYRAWQRVWENGGCRGADGVTLGRFRDHLEWELDSIQDSLLRHCYRPVPLLRFEVPKGDGAGPRDLAVPSVRDRVVQSAVYLVTGERFEEEMEDSSFAYRKGRSVRDAVAAIRDLRDRGYRWVLDADIVAFFDRVDHHLLFDRLHRLDLDPFVERLFHLWIEPEVYDGRSIRTLTQGIPQGAVVSPTLANLYLDQLDEELAAAGQIAVRYADDLVLLCKNEEDAAAALELTDDLLEDLALDLHPDKTHIRSFDLGFKFLGALFVGDSIFLPFAKHKEPNASPTLPPPLDLRTYLELKAVTDAPCRPSTSPSRTRSSERPATG